jgi:hypothetical protein
MKSTPRRSLSSEPADGQALAELISPTAEQLQAIGTVITEWAMAENTLRVCFFNVFGGVGAQKLESQPMAALAGAGMDYRIAVGLLRGVIRGLYPDQADEFDKRAEKLEKEGKRRHVIAHALWRQGRRPGSIQTTTLRSVGRIELERHEFTAEEMARLANRIRRARIAVVSWLRHLGYFDRTPPSPDKPT